MTKIKTKYKIGDLVISKMPLNGGLFTYPYKKEDLKNFKYALGIINKIKLKQLKDGSYDGVLYGIDWCDGWAPDLLVEEDTVSLMMKELKKLKRKRSEL